MGSVSGCHSRRLVFREEPYACHPPEITPIPLWRISQNGVTPIATITHGTLSIRKLNAIKKGCPIRSIPDQRRAGTTDKTGTRRSPSPYLQGKPSGQNNPENLPKPSCREYGAGEGPGYESSQRKARSLGGQLMDGRLGSSEAAEAARRLLRRPVRRSPRAVGGIASTLITAFVVSGINLLRLPFFQHHARQNTFFSSPYHNR